ncbi:MAG TPA: PDZ domain-containing protein [Acidimicrobiales bacterium]|nr:PDZ domain-containing protein [Acidimicrobiales bacterium]
MVVPDSGTGVPSGSGLQPAPERPLWLHFWWVPHVVIGLLTLAVSLNTDLPYYAIAPGDAREVDELIRAPEGRLYPSRGEVYLATVSLQRVKALGAVQGWLDDEVDVVPEEQILGRTPPAQYRQQNLQLMDDSKETAIVVALRQLGHNVPETGKGALVVQVSDGSPASGRLAPGDAITAVDGVPTTVSQAAVDRIRSHRPGEVARIEVTDSNGTTRIEEVTLGEREGNAFLGVVMQTKDRRFDKPFEVNIDSGRIGGPSAGLAFALGLIEQLSAGELTGGKKVAVTGTIDMNGEVGEVGGVAQKTAAVRNQGADVFLVPPGEYEVALSHAGSKLQIVKVATLEEAIQALGRLGGDITAATAGGSR